MKKNIFAFLTAAALSVVGSVSSAASLNLVASEPILTASDIAVDYLDLGFGEAGLTGFAEIADSSGVSLDGAASLFFDVSFTTAAPSNPVFGTLDVSDASGAVVEGDFVGFGFTGTTLELLFDVFGGRFDTEFGSQALVEFTLETGSGITLLSDLVDGDNLVGSATIGSSLAPVPLPAGLPLIVTGLAGMWVLRRRKAT